MKGKFKKQKEKLAEKVSGERVGKVLDRVSIEKKRKILKVLENRIEKGKIIPVLMDKLNIKEDEIKLLFKGVSKTGTVFETVAKEVLEHHGYVIAEENIKIRDREFDLITEDGTFVECKYRNRPLSISELDGYIKAVEKVFKTDFEPKPREFLIIAPRVGIASTVEKAIAKWRKRRFKVGYWDSDEFKEKFLDMKLEQGGLNWKKFGEIIFRA